MRRIRGIRKLDQITDWTLKSKERQKKRQEKRKENNNIRIVTLFYLSMGGRKTAYQNGD